MYVFMQHIILSSMIQQLYTNKICWIVAVLSVDRCTSVYVCTYANEDENFDPFFKK